MKAKKILIVEGDVFSRKVMEKILENHKYETSSCASAEEAVVKLQEESFGVLITDLRMQEMDGFELIRETRKIHPAISTVLVTGLTSEEIRLKAKEEGADGFFPRPIEWGELIGFLDTLLETRKEENQNIDRNNGEERYPSFRPRLLITLLLSLVTLFIIRISEAQEPFPKAHKPNFRMDSHGIRMPPPESDLTEEQAGAIANLQLTYAAEAIPLRMELMSLRLELRHLFRNPNVQPSILLELQRKISELQTRLDDLSLSYQIKARSILTKEQLEQLPPDFSMGMELGPIMGIGTGKGPQKIVR